MAALPTPDWLTLTETLDWLEARGIAKDDKTRETLIRAFRDDQLPTRGRAGYKRGPSYSHSSREVKTLLSPVTWDAVAIKMVDWDASAIVKEKSGFDGERKAVMDIDVSRASLEYWLGDAAAEATPASVDTNTLPSYVRFLITAAIALDAKNKPLLKKNIESWLSDNWPDYLGEKSRRDIASMATMLRPPEAKKGGYYNPDTDKG